MPCSRQSRLGRRPQATASRNCRPTADTNEIDDEPYFGDIPGSENARRFRVGCLNVNNLSPYAQGLGPKVYSTEGKDQGVCKAVKDLHIDVLLMQELGVNWAKVGMEHQWKARAGVYLDPNHIRSYMSHNTHSLKSSPLQAGGTGIMSYGKMAHISAGAGSDRAKLGRWTWTRYQGKHNTFLRCVSVYRPCGGNQGAETVAAQQKQYMQTVNDDRDPRTAFLEDFEQELQSWLAKGDHVIVGGDLNQKVSHQVIQDIFARHGLVNVIGTKHDMSEAPATFMYGSKVIDGLWATPGIQVSECGYFAPGDISGDHSLLWMDVSYESALGHRPPTPQTFKARRLRLYDSRTTTKYLDKYEEKLHQRQLIPRQIRLLKTAKYGKPLTPYQAREANAIDCLKTKAMLSAEKKCRKLKMGGVAFSLATEGPRRRINFWTLAIKRRRGGKVSSRLWRRKKRKAGIVEAVRILSLETMSDRLKAARQDYRNAKKNHKEERVTFLQTLKPKDRDRLIRVEKQRELGRAAKKVTGKLTNNSVVKVIHNGHECSDRNEVEAVLLQVNEAKIRACEDTPFLQEPLVSAFGFRNDTSATDDVLEGNYLCPAGTSACTQDLLSHLQTAPIPPDVQAYIPRRFISTEDNTKAWKRAKEKTAAGISGLHFGMFKAHILRPKLSALDASMRSLAYMTGFSYNRWKKGVDVQLLKKKKDYRAEKLRTILLLEADFNMNNKALGGDTMKLGERHCALTKDNYGGRKGHRAPEVGLNSYLTQDSIRGRRGRLIVISNDARGCYDRIAHTVLQIAMLRLGVPRPALQSMITTIQEMDHHVCTAFGVSDGKYGFDPTRLPTQGILQGNGAGPAGWFAISSVLIDAMRDAGFGYKDWTVSRGLAFQIASFAFVDDTDLLHVNNSPGVTTEDLIVEAQQMVTKWHGLLRATGGDLAPEKSYWYLVELHWKEGKWQYKTIDEAPGDIWLPGSQDPIERRSVDQPAEALGIQGRPDGKMHDEVLYLRDRVFAWSDGLRTGSIKKETAWYCFNATIMKTIEYPLLATTFSRQDIHQFMKPLLRAALNSFGVQKNLPRKLVYGTLKSRGLGIQDPFWTQLIQHLQVILRQAHRSTPTHMLLDENMDLVQMYVGSEINFWELPFEQYGSLAPNGWMKHTWESLSQTSLVIKGPPLAFPRRRQRDMFLMDAFVDMNYDHDTLATLNECRLFLHATTLADICTADGKGVDTRAWLGQRIYSRRYDDSRWIKTCDPGPKYWACWQQAVRHTFLFPHQQHLRVRVPLGLWYKHSDTQWKWWVDPVSRQLFCRHEDGSWSRSSGRRQVGQRVLYNSDIPISPDRVPMGLRRVTVNQPSGSPTISMDSEGFSAETPNLEVDTTAAAIAILPPESKWAVKHIRIPDDGGAIAEAIRQGSAVAVSDGSLKLGIGTSAFIVTNPLHQNPIVGANVVPGWVKDGDSHRCELSGIYGIIIVVHIIAQVFEISEGAIHVACDNKQALHVFHPDFLPDPQKANFDLINAIWGMLKSSPLTWTCEHVYGHQDTKNRHKAVTRLERLNIQMDTLAKCVWTQYARRSETLPLPVHQPITGEGWQIWSGTDKVINPSNATLYDLLQDNVTQTWWIRHGLIKRDTVQDIDWDGTNDVMHYLSPAERRYVTKNSSGNCGVGVTQVLWKYQTDACCPRCGAHEDSVHVYRCNGLEADKEWHTNMTNLKNYLDETRTDPSIQEAMISCVSYWRQGQAIVPAQFSPSVRPVIYQQHAIGWQQLLEGLPSVRWRRLQQRFYDRQKIRKSSKLWLQGTLAKLIRLGRGQWLHRNDEKHVRAKPRHKRAAALLHNAIIWLYAKRTRDLLPGDHSQMDVNLCDLLQRSESYRQSWYLNVVAARNRCLRIRHHDPELEDHPPHDHDIRLWIQGRPR